MLFESVVQVLFSTGRRLDRGNAKVVKGLVLHTEMTDAESTAASSFENGFDINKVMRRRDQDRTGVLNSR
jgi:hypothetical protein